MTTPLRYPCQLVTCQYTTSQRKRTAGRQEHQCPDNRVSKVPSQWEDVKAGTSVPG